MRVDAHHHLWRYSAAEYGWIDERMKYLRRDFIPADLEPELMAAHVDATVVVQARQTLEETEWLLEEAGRTPWIRGVVGWAPLAGCDFATTLEQLRQNPLLKGLRHVVQGEPKGFLGDNAFNRGITDMLGSGVVYELLIYADQIEEATAFVDRHPNQIFVLDHIAKPNIAGDGFDAWEKPFRGLARRENIVCKLSGMVTEADWNAWSPSTLQPYFDTALEAFGPGRLMCGSDWPVLTVAASYERWWMTLSEWLAPLSELERSEIEGGVAMRIYNIERVEG